MALVLVVDDSAEIRLMLEDFLVLEGHSVLLASDGEMGCRLLESHAEEIHLLISDIYMPEMDGLEVIRLARRLKPNLRIIAMSAGDSKGDLASLGFAGDFGAEALLPKPFRMPELVVVVNRLLGK